MNTARQRTLHGPVARFERNGLQPISKRFVAASSAWSADPLAARMRHRLLYLVGQLGAGGLERQLYYLLRGLNRERYRSVVVVWNGSAREFHAASIRELGVPQYFLPRNASPAAKLKTLRRLVLELEPEVIHSYSFYTNFAAHWAARGTTAVAVGSVRGDFSRTKKDCGPFLGSLSARWPRAQIFNSFSAAEAAKACRSLFAPKHRHVVPNGLDPTWLCGAPGPDDGKVEILGVGTLLSVKRWDRALRAALALKTQGFQFQMRIVGGGPLKESLKQQAESMGVSDRVAFLGERADVPDLLRSSAFLLHTSDSEGCPNVVMEAMACGRPVVATDAGDAPMLVEHGRTGYVVARADEHALVARMAALMQDANLRRRMGEAGRLKAEHAFALQNLVAATLAAYRAAGWRDKA